MVAYPTHDDARNYNVPINESLKKIIPVDQEIIYSTHISVRYHIKNLSDNVGWKHPSRTGFLLGGVSGAVIAPLANKLVKAIYLI